MPGETVRGGGFTHRAGRQGRQPGAGRGARRRQGAHDRRGRQGCLRRRGAGAACKDGRSTSPACAKPHAATGIALIFVDAKGENVIVVVPGANDTVLPGDLAKAHLAKGEVVLLQHEIPLATVEAALDAAAAAGAVSVLNTAPFRAEAAQASRQGRLCRRQRNRIRPLRRGAGAFRPRPRRAHARLRRAHRPHDHRHAGRRRRRRRSPEAISAVPALKITPVDTVGAGDTFCGYLGAGLAAGLPLEQALRRAAAAGSLACLKPGAQPAIPRATEVDAALAEPRILPTHPDQVGGPPIPSSS